MELLLLQMWHLKSPQHCSQSLLQQALHSTPLHSHNTTQHNTTHSHHAVNAHQLQVRKLNFNPLNAKLNPICHLLALLAHHILHISMIRVKHAATAYICSVTHLSPSFPFSWTTGLYSHFILHSQHTLYALLHSFPQSL